MRLGCWRSWGRESRQSWHRQRLLNNSLRAKTTRRSRNLGQRCRSSNITWRTRSITLRIHWWEGAEKLRICCLWRAGAREQSVKCRSTTLTSTFKSCTSKQPKSSRSSSATSWLATWTICRKFVAEQVWPLWKQIWSGEKWRAGGINTRTYWTTGMWTSWEGRFRRSVLHSSLSQYKYKK